MSKIGLGIAALGRPGYINLGHDIDFVTGKDKETMQNHAHTMFDYALKHNITYFDTARGYGLGEQFLANWDNKEPITIGSKWGYTYTANWQTNAKSHEIKDLSVSNFRKQLQESQSVLNGDLKIYHIHSATIESGVLEDDELINELWALKETGTIVGLSTSGVNQSKTIEKALTIHRNKQLLFTSYQVTFNVYEQSCKAVLEQAHKLGASIIIKEAVANGRLTSRNASFDELPIIKSLTQKYSCNSDAIAIAFILQQPWLNTVLSGASTIEQLESNLKATHISFTKAELAKLENLQEEVVSYWNTRSSLEWN